MSCRIDIETAILDQVFNEVVEDRNTYTREGDNVIVINSKADNSKSKTSNRQAAYKIAQERLDYIKKSFKGQVTGTISETNDYEPIKIKLFVKPEYIEYEYSKLPEEQQTDSKDYLNLEDEGNYTTNEEGDVIIKNEEVLGLPNELSQSEITQEPIDYSQEPKFRKNNPDFDSERYVNDQGKFGKVEAPLDESLTPFLSETREKAQQYSAEFIADSFKSKDKPNERKFNRPTNLPESFRLVWGEVDSNKFNALATDELGGILRWVRRMDRQNSKEQSIPFVKGVMGRDAKSIYSENGGNDVDTKTRYGILRVIQSINDSDVLLGIFRRLGMGEIRVINNKRLNSLFVHKKLNQYRV